MVEIMYVVLSNTYEYDLSRSLIRLVVRKLLEKVDPRMRNWKLKTENFVYRFASREWCDLSHFWMRILYIS